MFYRSFLATMPLHSSSSISVLFYTEISWDLPSGYCITALPTRDAAHSLMNLSVFYTLHDVFICASYLSFLNYCKL